MHIDIKMMGGLYVTVDGKTKDLPQDKMTKPWQLFCYIALRNGEVVSNGELINVIWADSELTDEMNVLKNTVYALRRDLEELADTDENPIVFKKSGYTFSDCVDLKLDVDNFIALCGKADSETDSTLKEKACSKAISAYTDQLLPMIAAEPWVVLETRKCVRRYINCAHALCDIQCRNEKWDELYTTAHNAIELDMLDEQSLLHVLRSLEKQDKWYDILVEYSHIAKHSIKISGGSMSEEIERIYKEAQSRVDEKQKGIAFIRDDITFNQTNGDNAYFCSYDMLRYVYPFLQRTSEHGKKQLMLMLITVECNSQDMKKERIQAMESCYRAISGSMRRSDAFARYGDSRFAAIVAVTSKEDIYVIQKRLDAAFANILLNDNYKLSYKSTTL